MWSGCSSAGSVLGTLLIPRGGQLGLRPPLPRTTPLSLSYSRCMEGGWFWTPENSVTPPNSSSPGDSSPLSSQAALEGDPGGGGMPPGRSASAAVRPRLTPTPAWGLCQPKGPLPSWGTRIQTKRGAPTKLATEGCPPGEERGVAPGCGEGSWKQALHRPPSTNTAP